MLAHWIDKSFTYHPYRPTKEEKERLEGRIQPQDAASRGALYHRKYYECFIIVICKEIEHAHKTRNHPRLKHEI
jgi:hypothetical protein